VYFSPFIKWESRLQDAETPLFITEGALKAACATKLGLPVLALIGVYCFKSTNLYRTQSLQFAAYVVVNDYLRLDHCVVVGRNVVFCFADPDRRGQELMNAWLSSNPAVPQKTLHEVLRMLRTEITNALAGGRSDV
jgi:hypothetical protein